MNQILDKMSELPSLQEWAKAQNTSALGMYLQSDLERPLICIGSGGAFSVCELIALMYETMGGVAKAVTPYSVYSMSDKTLQQCKILLVSHSGHNKDIVRIAKHCMEFAPMWVTNLTTADGSRNDIKKIVPPERSFNFSSGVADGFISVNSVLANYALVIKSLRGTCDITFPAFENDMDLTDVDHFMILYGGWGKPAAIDLESKLVESGVATCAVNDLRNFCHGRFIFAGNHCGHPKRREVPDDVAIIMMTTPREENFARKIREILPKNCKVVNVHSIFDDSRASMELLYKVSVLAGEIAEAHAINPLSPPNYGGIDKRKPQQIPFISDIKNAGPLTI